MNIQLVNRQATLSTVRLQAMLAFLAPRFGQVARPVLVTVLLRRWGRQLGRAYWPTRGGKRQRETRPGCYDLRIFVPSSFTWSFPLTRTYREEAGPARLEDLEELYLHVLAHELRHVEQFDACQRLWPHGMPVASPEPGGPTHLPFGRSFRAYVKQHCAHGSSEVDAETAAHGHLAAWREQAQESGLAMAMGA